MSPRSDGARRRLDTELVRRGMASSRSEAARLIADGRVLVAGAPVMKASSLVRSGDSLSVDAAGDEYASRGGHKLAGALAVLPVPVEGRHCLDAGASTGGFTDVLLRRGAARVIAVDVGYGQLLWRLRSDPRVHVMERVNARALAPDDIPPPPPTLVVADLSFISLALVLPALRAAAAPDADFILLVKPQFEAGAARVGKGGVVRDPGVWAEVMHSVIAAGAGLGLGLSAAVASPLPGPAGNIEFFVHLAAEANVDVDAAVRSAVEQGQALGGRPLE